MPAQNFRGFAEKVALVTGGARGVGRAVALQLALEGAYVIVSYAPGDAEGESVAHELRSLGTLAQAIAADVSRAAEVRGMFEFVAAAYGRLDLLVNAAGISRESPLGELSEAAWDEVLDVNLKGAFLCAQGAAPLMRGRPSPSILNVAAEAGMTGRTGAANYVAAQAGLIGLTKALARELAPGVRVNCVAVGGAGLIDEIAGRNTLTEPCATNEAQGHAPPQPVADEVARACLYLLSSDARSISGETLVVAGRLR